MVKFRRLHSHRNAAPEAPDRRSTMDFIFEAYVACKGKKSTLNMANASRPDACGEDSFFIDKKTNTLGITDGVGGWNNQNVDPSQISRRMMFHANQVVLDDQKQGRSSTPIQILTRAYDHTLADATVDAGSTTCCILKLVEDENHQPILQYANLGDSGFLIIRDDEIIFRSDFQSIGPAPYQLAKIPPRLRNQGHYESQPSEADTGQIPLRHNDVVVMATDGVWDNFAPDLEMREKYRPPLQLWHLNWHDKLESFVDTINASESNPATNVLTAALRHNLKPDDITVIVAQVKTQP